MNLDDILAAGWANPSDLSSTEFAQAEQFWTERRADDTRLQDAYDSAAQLIETWTGRQPRDVGSFGTRLNLDSSDLDLGIAYPTADRHELIAALNPHTTYKGERYTRFDTTRLVFAFTHHDIDIDVSALTEEDFTVACRMLDQINTGMTRDERIAHTWIKHQLRTAGRHDDYAAWKLVVYARYCPEFNWVPISESA
jgi:hypothetical protein